MRPTLQDALTEARDLPAEELIYFLADLEVLRLTAHARLLAPPAQAAHDDWVGINEAARVLNHCVSYLYHNWKRFSFAKRIDGKILFSRAGMEKYLKTARAA
jgi:hypothetical protein